MIDRYRLFGRNTCFDLHIEGLSSLRTLTQEDAQIGIELTRKTIRESIDCTYSYQPHDDVVCTVIK